ncbi:interferon-induced GTP-binding protein Mx [Colletotrichum liriopes]|uniref:Interferon-induced GTP-binding protein Mx n=1 Tax=Colletotrichum liriopes TaxID=708192 RepID=A0AA37H203_9PEZI|nr:interferon-induced GTP-binding protein Mx [Colletotrichum liriopes]
MDSIDSLRSQGIDHLVSLPQIIVCGDQSSGKSSVLEAISGVSFPIKSNLCTRFPTELVLRRTCHVGARVSIVPHPSRSEPEKVALSSFEEKLEDFEGFAALIDSAKSAMGISTHGKAFAKDLLRVEISGPDRPHLTIVDLPGLIHSQTKHQTASDVQLIQEVVESYMMEPRSIILAVVSAKNDFANQVVLKLARSADATGDRTLGVITKPDTLHPGSQSETIYVSLARNQEVEFRLGWHVLKNMDTETGIGSLPQRDAQETAFFSQGVWQELPHTILGINQLRGRLSKVLLSHITSELPSLIDEIESKRNACRDKLKKYGRPRITPYEQQLHLLELAESFQRLVKSAIDGNWSDLFFKEAESEHGYQRRVRAVIQNLNDNFAKRLLGSGHRRHIITSKTTRPQAAISVTRDEFIDHIEVKMRRSRGRELPGLYDPMIVADLFREQASPWEQLARDHIRKSWNACKLFLEQVVEHIADYGTSATLTQKIIGPTMDNILVALHAKTSDVLKAHQHIHPITYNHYFTETIQKVRADRRRSECASAVMRFFGVKTLGEYSVSSVDLSKLVDTVVGSTTEPDMNQFAASEALDHMDAYYKVRQAREKARPR